jgi:hypothetical protein
MALPKKYYNDDPTEKNLQDRLRSVYLKKITNEDLTEFERTRLEQYNKVGALLSYNLSIKYAMLTVAKDYSLSDSQAYAVVREAMAFYGDIMKFSKEAQRYFLYEKFIMLAIKAEKDGDILQAESCYDKAAKLYKLYENESERPDAKAYFPTLIIPIVVDTTPPPSLETLTTIQIVE